MHSISINFVSFTSISWESSTGVFVDLETEVKSRFLNHEEPRMWFLTDLEQGMVHEPPDRNHFLYAKYGAVHCSIINTFKMVDAHGKITFKLLTPPLCWK